jgi:hypothetical protein
VIEKHGVDSARDEISVWMNVVVVRNGDHAVGLLCVEQQLICRSCAERGDFSVSEI